MASNQNNFLFKYEDVIRYLPDRLFYPVVADRLNLPLSKLELEQHDLSDEDIEYWTIEYLIEKLFKQLASTKVIIEYENQPVTIHKYFTQARRIWKWIPITRPPPLFIINTSDLYPRLVLELYSLNKPDYDYVLRRAVCRIFEYIDPKEYRVSISKKLHVRLDR